ncbi:IMP cyclohydrolase-like protein [Lachnospiraceae bacterium]|nr:IMP cyclohydrolase-like protein [Lachnospiraceae bacterium]
MGQGINNVFTFRRIKMENISLTAEVGATSYPGRGVIIGLTPDGKNAAIGYFIMGRSSNSRNRIFVTEGEGIRTEAFDPSKLEDPSLIIYAPVRVRGNDTIVTNGDQTDTIYDLMSEGKTFEESLRTREFEPDGPNYTPRISGILHIPSTDFTTSTNEDSKYSYEMSILKSNNGDPSACNRYTFSYDVPLAGEAHFIHTYMGDGNPLPSFEGEPTPVKVETNDLDEFTEQIWNALNDENKVSLFTRFINIENGETNSRIINKNK